MSHANGTCTFNDGVVCYFEYNGTVDITLPELYSTKEELRENWRKDIDWGDVTQRRADAGDSLEDVELYSEYGGGFSYKGTASKKQMIIVWDEVSEETHKQWWER